MATQYRCRNEKRRQLVEDARDASQHPFLNGIDYLEVDSADQTRLILHFLHPVPGQAGGAPSTPVLTKGHFQIRGGARIKDLRVEGSPVAAGKQVTLRLNAPGDFSTYTLALVAQPGAAAPPDGFDPQLSEVEFCFKVSCPSDFDCAARPECPPEKLVEPEINYLAKDYASFRRLMLDRLSALMPDWQERNPADLEVALVELLAYVGDHLSYAQDVVATEAYLGTARQRISVRRHARLLDYPMHDGCNARAWVVLEADANAENVTLPGPQQAYPGSGPDAGRSGTLLLTQTSAPKGPIPEDRLATALREGPQVFEIMHDLTLHAAHNELHFYTWSDERCCLPRGATRATLADHYPDLHQGDVLIFEEVRGPTTGEASDADPSHRHAVRLTFATVKDEKGHALRDLLNGQPITEIAWDAEDALPFPLCISAVTDTAHGLQPVEDVSVARGNVVLADHGRTIPRKELCEQSEELPPAGAVGYRPRLREGPVTQQGRVRARKTAQASAVRSQTGSSSGSLMAVDGAAPAAEAFRWELRHVLPAIRLIEAGPLGETWLAERDLLGSERFARVFVAEIEAGGRARLRFGDDITGRRPGEDAQLSAVYRVGNGRAGNVGAEAIAHVITGIKGIVSVRNPLPARGGTEPEALEQVRQYAPQAFRRQERAVTEADWAEVAGRHPEVSRAAATVRWTGSWHTVFVTVDRKLGREVDADFKNEMRAYLERYRIAGYDLEINSPVFVPLDILLLACARPGHYRANVKEVLLARFSNRETADGKRGFFHPDNFTFADPVYLSRIYEAAMEVAGVASVVVRRFQRFGKTANSEIDKGVLTTAPLEIVRLDNDPNFPENGKIEFQIEGGL
jgi:hypothetical protein